MNSQMNQVNKNRLINNLVENLPVLRAKLNITQEELAQKMGVTRQTLTLIESKKRELSWNTFLCLIMIFSTNESTRQMLEIFEIYTQGLERMLKFE